MNIDEMPAGPEIDALVAERVMGWEVKRTSETFGLSGDPLPALYFDPGSGEKCWRENGKRFWQEWRPSEDVAAAFEVVEELRQSGDWCCLVIDSDYNFLWTVRLTPSSVGSKHEPTIVTMDESLPLAIVRAVLAAVEEKT